MPKSETIPNLGKDEHFLSLALEEARRGIGLTSPNPPVGAVIVRGTRVIGRGFHLGVGRPHAEIEAIEAVRRDAGSKAPSRLKGATIYITMEPCSTTGRTPPCTSAIIEAGFARVVFGARDPNPAHRGRATRLLRSSGISVSPGVLEKECQHLIRMFRKFILTKTPFLIAKSALTLDGRITREKGGPQWITGPDARKDVHKLRSQVDAIIIGGETLRRDNPRLTVRGVPGRKGASQPWRVVLTRSGKLPSKSRIFNDIHKDRSLVYQGRSLRQVLRDLGRRGVVSALLEAGGDLTGRAFKAELVDEVRFYFAPRIGGGNVRGVDGAGFSNEFRDISIEPVGKDFRVTGTPDYPNKAKKSTP